MKHFIKNSAYVVLKRQKEMKGIEYLKQVSEKIDNLTDEEFMSLLVKSGLNECPYEVTFTQKPKHK